MGNIKSKSIILGAAAALGGVLFFGHSAYAASYINVSSGSGGTVSFGSIKPTSTGTSATASDTLTVHTDCSVGYSVYVSGQNGKDTNLTNKSAESDNIISTSSNAIGSAGSLNVNTWGLNYENTGAYVGLPGYDDALTSTLTTKSDVEETSMVDIYYGLKVNTALTPGTYTGDVLYTVIMDSSCQAYTVIFNSNGGTGTMANQSIMAGTTTALTANSFTRTDYTFLGWSTKATGKTETAVDGIGTEADVDYTDKAEVTNLTTGGSSITLYAIWQKSDGTMQGWAGCASMSAGDVVNLVDLRDNSTYRIKKFTSDGSCWMIDNLIIGHDKGYTLTSKLTNISDEDDETLSDNGTYYLPQAGYRGALNSPDALGTANFYSDDTNSGQAQVQYNQVGSTDSSGNIVPQSTGYYNFYTATLGCSYQGDGLSKGQCSSGYVARDICPKGWQLPVYGSASTRLSWSSLDHDINPTISNAGTNRRWDTASLDNFLNEGDFLLTGEYRSSPTFVNVGAHGRWWSSTVYTSANSYNLILGKFTTESQVYPQWSDGKSWGIAVRCVAKDWVINYSNGDASGEATKTSEIAYGNGSIITPEVGTMVKSGYEFKGWALTSGATTVTYSTNQAVSLSDILTAASSAGQSTTPGSTITIYPVWWQIFDTTTMQGWAANNGCNALSANQYLTLKDARDDNKYVVKKLADGKCWMVQNLRLVDYKLTPADSDISTDFTLAASAGNSGWCKNNNTACDDQSMVYYDASKSTTTTDASYYGALYNWYAATAGTGTYSFSSSDATSSICPKGWRLPIGGADVATNEFSILDIAWGGDGTNQNKASTWSTFIGDYASSDNGGFGRAGYIYGSVDHVGASGYYWSSTVKDANEAYPLNLYSSNVNPWYYSRPKNFGSSVRCIARQTTMQETSASNLAEETTTALKDSRDNQTYTVYRWPSSGTAGTDYPTGMAGYAIMTKDLSLGYVTGGSITKGKDLALTDDTSAAAGTITARVSANDDWSIEDTSDNLQYINGSSGTYDSHSYYTWGATQKVCPKGWRPPTSMEYYYIIAFMGGNTEDGRAKMSGTPYDFTFGGFVHSNAYGFVDVGTGGSWWSSTQSSDAFGNGIYFNSSRLNVDGSGTGLGRSVRCIATP